MNLNEHANLQFCMVNNGDKEGRKNSFWHRNWGACEWDHGDASTGITKRNQWMPWAHLPHTSNKEENDRTLRWRTGGEQKKLSHHQSMSATASGGHLNPRHWRKGWHPFSARQVCMASFWKRRDTGLAWDHKQTGHYYAWDIPDLGEESSRIILHSQIRLNVQM